MNQELQEHFGDEDIIRISIHPETEKWREELQFTQKEIRFYTSLLMSPLSKKTGSAPVDSEFLLRQLESIKKTNTLYLQNLVDYRNKLEGLKECEDVQCENFYIKDHLAQKKSVHRHLKNFRTLKEIIHKFLHKGLKKTGCQN